MPVIIQFFKDMSHVRLAAVCLGILTFVLLFIVYISKISGKDMALLYSELEAEDSGKIIQELESKNIPYQLLDDGHTIKVPRDQVVKARVNLAQAGIPNKGSIVGYEIFDKEDSIGTTNFSQNVKMVRALEGEIARTIASFEQVDKVRVHLVLPQKEIFSKERLDPRASVIIRFKNKKNFNKAEVDAVSHFIVTAVPGLDIKNVTIVDSYGKSLKLGAQDEEAEFSGARGEEYRVAYENRLKKVIEDLLEQSLGAGKAKAQVAVEMNFDRTVINTESYDPDSAVIRSVQTMDERESTPVGGEDNVDISVANNIPGGGAGGAQNQNLATTEKSDQTTNYEISRTVKNQISESGVVTKLSIGVLVDGTYKPNAETQKTDYIPRSNDEIEKITNLVKVAVGFDAERKDKIEVINMQFNSDLNLFDTEEEPHWLKDELPNLFQTLVFAVVVVLILVTVIRPITLKAFEVKRANDNLLTGLGISGDMATSSFDVGGGGGMPGGGSEAYDSGKVGERTSLKSEANTQRINELVVFYPQEMLNVLRKWLDEGK
ncbi:Flagellar M-ring protein FliF [Candidatus Trichorickettsia mobilis]|uniref:Flagellar M-ring protein n=1 Tax=Candidatus Trichorickettsia mobilis TaxID=1346319 RepID=A0ABZ0UWG1_9RICK|nr:flagellar basal-body MS-ring/collar protein FliF [Candidatus Trichorickettsia mobilis]WPY00952.1 Flagellar M-ring protein FliF [Candidatus Trichorickettsia mobilis]